MYISFPRGGAGQHPYRGALPELHAPAGGVPEDAIARAARGPGVAGRLPQGHLQQDLRRPQTPPVSGTAQNMNWSLEAMERRVVNAKGIVLEWR